MNPVIHKEKSLAIVCDASRIISPAAEYFRVGYWRSVSALEGSAPGRGNAWFIDTPFGHLALRRYARGGLAAHVSREHYFFTTVERSRPFKEFQILSDLSEAGLEVPLPLAAICEYRGFLSKGALLTARIPATQTLADRLPGLEDQHWAAIGQSLARFHQGGVWHADLNARNILLDNQGQVFLVDFDRARYTPGRPVNGDINLKRLKRSLVKLWPKNDQTSLESAWGNLLGAYHA